MNLSANLSKFGGLADGFQNNMGTPLIMKFLTIFSSAQS